MNIVKPLVLIALSSSLLLAAPQAKKNAELQNIKKIGKSSSMLLLKTLGSKMKKNMKAGGPMQALDFCSQEAYVLTEDVNKKLPNGIRVKRISSKYRNPANKPEADEQAILNALQELKNSNVILPKQIVEKVNATTYKYYKPLIINKAVCLKCHGNITNTDLKRAISKRYPIDKAMHYKMGDLRGAVVVTIKK
ncbi:Tll0287-like domain-containing protein [Sulfurimonas sp.]